MGRQKIKPNAFCIGLLYNLIMCFLVPVNYKAVKRISPDSRNTCRKRFTYGVAESLIAVVSHDELELRAEPCCCKNCENNHHSIKDCAEHYVGICFESCLSVKDKGDNITDCCRYNVRVEIPFALSQTEQLKSGVIGQRRMKNGFEYNILKQIKME